MGLAYFLKFVEESIPGSLGIENFELDGVERGVGGISLAVFAIDYGNSVVTFFFFILRHAD